MMLKDIAKGIFKAAATAYGTRVLVERVVPAAENIGSKVLKKVKNMKGKKTEAAPSQDPPEETDLEAFKTAATRVSTNSSKIVDAEVED
jgi:hypothetical protein